MNTGPGPVPVASDPFDPMTTVSVIVPVYDDPAGIRATLESLLALDYPPADHEILVVDNGSTDDTRAVAKRLVADADHARVLVEDGVQSSYAARNRGIAAAAGEILAFVDADMSVDPGWLAALVEVFETRDVDYVGCAVEVYLPPGEETFLGRYNVADGFPVAAYLDEHDYAPTCCMAVRRAVVEDVGAFDPAVVSGGDQEFGVRVARAGYDQYFAGHVTMYHPARTSLGEHVRKSLRHGRGREQLYRAYGGGRARPWYHPRQVLPPHPLRFRRRLAGDHGPATLVAFYLVSYLLKLVIAASQVDAHVRGTDAAS